MVAVAKEPDAPVIKTREKINRNRRILAVVYPEPDQGPAGYFINGYRTGHRAGARLEPKRGVTPHRIQIIVEKSDTDLLSDLPEQLEFAHICNTRIGTCRQLCVAPDEEEA